MTDSIITIVIAILCAAGLMWYLWWASSGNLSDLLTNPSLRKNVPMAAGIAFAVATVLSVVFSSVRRKLRQGEVNKATDDYDEAMAKERGNIEALDAKASIVEDNIEALEGAIKSKTDDASEAIAAASDHRKTADDHKAAGEDALARADNIRDQ